MIAIIHLTMLGTILASVQAQEQELKRATRGVTGFEDSIIVCGPGTDGAYDSPEGIARMVKRWKKRGYDGIYFRVSELFLPDKYMIHWDRNELNPVTNFLFVPPKRAIDKFDVLGTVISEGNKQGVDIWVWYPTIYSNGAPPNGPNFSQQWLYENRFGHEHPEVLSIDRQGNKHYMIWEYAYPQARQAKIDEFVYLAKRYGVKRFVACLRTEAGQMQPPPEHADQFGFNKPVVDDMKRRYNVDILTDPRFDYKNPAFDVHDPMLENWRNLRGEYLTQLYRELRAALNEVDPSIEIAVQVPGERVGSCLGNWKVDWRTWIEEGLVNEISYRETLDNYTFQGTEFEPSKRGYLDIDKPEPEVFRTFINQSSQPTVRLIQQGGPAMSFNSPPPYANGWRVDQWPELFSLAVAQRWQQWQRDVKDFGHIKFLETNFDDFPDSANGYGGGYGEFAYRPDLRRCPGYWFKLGDGLDSLPVVQGQVRRGEQGLAMKLTRDENGASNLAARHCGQHDRNRYPFWTDTIISSGTCRVEYWVLLPDTTASFVNFVSYDLDKNNDIGISVAAETGIVSYSHQGSFVQSTAALKPGSWQRVAIDVDLERHVYSVSVGPDADSTTDVCREVPYKNKFNALNWLDFAPQGKTGSTLYLDDVAWRWIPAKKFVDPGDVVLLDEGFEGLSSGKSARQLATSADDGATEWRVENGDGSNVVIDPTISYGDEYQSLRFKGQGGTAVASASRFRFPTAGSLVMDLDILPRSGDRWQNITSTPSVKSLGETGAGIFDTRTGAAIAAVRVIDGIWNCWSQNGYKSTGIPAAIDVFSHLQIVIDSATKTYRVSIQVMGEVPRSLWQGPLGDTANLEDHFTIQLENRREVAKYDGSAMDNLLVTSKTDE